MREIISTDEFQNLTRSLVDLSLSSVWRGVGSAIFLEFGQLRSNGTKNAKGEVTVMIEWSWRVERARSVMFGSFSGERKLTRGLQSLIGRKVIEVALEGRLPELVVELSGAVWIHSFTTVEGHPEWTLFLPDNNCLSSHLGRLVKEMCGVEHDLSNSIRGQANARLERTRR